MKQHLAPTLITLALAASHTAPAQPEPAPPEQAPDQPANQPANQQPTTPAEQPERASAENAALDNEMTPELERAIAESLDALAELQREDGSFGGTRYGSNAGITALACLAFMADGSTTSRGPHAAHIKHGLEFILDNTNETGLIAGDTSHGPMYGHGFAALFLGEVYGMTGGGPDTELSARVHDALVRAVRLIVRTQNDEGGWRYNPVPHDADVSVTICQIMALRSARNAGLEVPTQTIDRAVEYVRACQNNDGGFKYQLNRGGSAWPRSAAGVASLFYAGIYQDDAIDQGLRYIRDNALPGATSPPGHYYYYGHYYAVQTMYLAGGDWWALWWPAIREELISKRSQTGIWTDSAAGTAYATAMSLIILQMPKRYLPIFQK